jgi:hypothetical protein
MHFTLKLMLVVTMTCLWSCVAERETGAELKGSEHNYLTQVRTDGYYDLTLHCKNKSIASLPTSSTLDYRVRFLQPSPFANSPTAIKFEYRSYSAPKSMSEEYMKITTSPGNQGKGSSKTKKNYQDYPAYCNETVSVFHVFEIDENLLKLRGHYSCWGKYSDGNEVYESECGLRSGPDSSAGMALSDLKFVQD